MLLVKLCQDQAIGPKRGEGGVNRRQKAREGAEEGGGAEGRRRPSR